MEIRNNERILEYLRPRTDGSRQEIAHALGTDPRNLNRNLNQLLQQGEVKVSKKVGREIFYRMVTAQGTHEMEVSPIETPPMHLYTPPPPRSAKTANLKEILKSESHRWITQQELQERTGIVAKHFSENIHTMLQSGEVEWAWDNRNKIYHFTNIVVAPPASGERFTDLEATVNRIKELKAFNDSLKANLCSIETWQTYDRILIHFYHFRSGAARNFAITPPERITLQDIHAFIIHCRDEHHYGRNSEKGVVIALKSYFKFLTEVGLIKKNLMATFRVPNTPPSNAQGLTLSEFKEMFRVANNFRDETLLLFLLITGARVKEIERATLQDINWTQNKITIHGAKMKHNGGMATNRIDEIPPWIMQRMQRYIEEFRGTPTLASEQALFLNKQGTKLVRDRIEEIIKHLVTKAGIQKHIIPHSFRHTCITYLWSNGNGWDIKKISDHVGHVRTSQTWDYIVSIKMEVEQPLSQESVIEELITMSKEKEEVA
jgi:integrase/recombinase XerD